MSYFLFERYQEKKSTMCLTADLIFPQVNKASEVIVTVFLCVNKAKVKKLSTIVPPTPSHFMTSFLLLCTNLVVLQAYL